MSVECVSCGVARPDPVPLVWVCEDGQRWLCPGCVRHHLRDMEAKLAPEWWSGSA